MLPLPNVQYRQAKSMVQSMALIELSMEIRIVTGLLMMVFWAAPSTQVTSMNPRNYSPYSPYSPYCFKSF